MRIIVFWGLSWGPFILGNCQINILKPWAWIDYQPFQSEIQHAEASQQDVRIRGSRDLASISITGPGVFVI